MFKKRTTLVAMAILSLFASISYSHAQSNGAKKVDLTKQVPAVKKQFTFVREEATKGSLRAIAELGATGFNTFIIKKDGRKWSLEKALYGQSGVIEASASDTSVEKQLKTAIKGLIAEKVPGAKIFFVVSSGAAKEPVVAKVKRLLKKQGYYVNIVSPSQEARYGYEATVPKEFEDKAFFVDMGSGNTKIAYKVNGRLITKETYGAKYYTKHVDNKLVADEVGKIISKIPAHLRQHCFFIGGVPYKLAKFTNNGNIKPRYITLSLNPEDYQGYAKEKGAKIEAGLNIYRAILSNATECEYSIWDSKANFSIGFLLRMK